MTNPPPYMVVRDHDPSSCPVLFLLAERRGLPTLLARQIGEPWVELADFADQLGTIRRMKLDKLTRSSLPGLTFGADGKWVCD